MSACPTDGPASIVLAAPLHSPNLRAKPAGDASALHKATLILLETRKTERSRDLAEAAQGSHEDHRFMRRPFKRGVEIVQMKRLSSRVPFEPSL
jgi:hypothetical protein